MSELDKYPSIKGADLVEWGDAIVNNQPDNDSDDWDDWFELVLAAYEVKNNCELVPSEDHPEYYWIEFLNDNDLEIELILEDDL